MSGATSASPARERPAASPSLPGAASVWSLAFAYAAFMALMLQKLILPVMPELHAGHGLMTNDAIIFHDMAVAMAEQIKAHGWSAWRLFPADGITGNVGLLAALYVFLGPDPAWFVPLNAAFHALGALMIYLIGAALWPGAHGRLGGLVAAFLFLTFPSSLVWYGQNHKDAFMIAGLLVALWAFLDTLRADGRRPFAAQAGWMAAGLALVATMRPYMLIVIAAAFLAAWLVVAACAACTRSGGARAGRALALVLVAGLFAAVVPPENSAASLSGKGAPIRLEHWRWQAIPGVPRVLDRIAERVSTVRAHVIESGRKVGAGSLVDDDIAPQNIVEMAAYLPRALLVGLATPFPATWTERPTLPRVIGAMETLVWYLLVPGVAFLLWRGPGVPLAACLVFAAALLTVLGYFTPNVGTLHRVRYAPWFLFLLAGAIGWVQGVATLLPRAAAGPGGAARESAGESLAERGAVVGDGVTVLLITAVGYLGLFARDLLLIGIHGFGARLDSLFAALVLPMFLVSVASLPLGDALIAALQRSAGVARERVALVRAAVAFSLALCGGLCVLLFAFADRVFPALVGVAEPGRAAELMRLSLPLLLLSGVAVAGNSVLSALHRAKAAAVAQLMVPVCAIAAILLADAEQALSAAILGMIAGQLGNIAFVAYVARQEGFRLLPGSPRAARGWREAGANFAGLALAAAAVNVANPINLWFAGHLPVGSVSLWGMGSKLIQLVTGLTAAVMAGVVAPYLARIVARGGGRRLRGDLYFLLVAGTWAGIVAALFLFGFTEPLVMAAFAHGATDADQALRLAAVVKLGALQIPFLFATLLQIKLAAVSRESGKVVLAALASLALNVALNVALIADFGVVGLAASATGSAAASAFVLLLLTQPRSGLSSAQLFAIVGSWAVLGGFAIALHLHSVATAVSAAVLLLFVAWAQWRAGRSAQG